MYIIMDSSVKGGILCGDVITVDYGENFASLLLDCSESKRERDIQEVIFTDKTAIRLQKVNPSKGDFIAIFCTYRENKEQTSKNNKKHFALKFSVKKMPQQDIQILPIQRANNYNKKEQVEVVPIAQSELDLSSELTAQQINTSKQAHIKQEENNNKIADETSHAQEQTTPSPTQSTAPVIGEDAPQIHSQEPTDPSIQNVQSSHNLFQYTDNDTQNEDDALQGYN